MNIILLEDDHIQAKDIKEKIENSLSYQDAHVRIIKTENKFYEYMANLSQKEWPDVFILDIMVRWTDAERNIILPPPHIKKAGYYRAGFRCAEKIKKMNPDIPVILYTVLETNDWHVDYETLSNRYGDSKIDCLTKNADCITLIDKIKSFM